MSAIKFELDATSREDIGKGASRRLRRSDKVPGVVYGAGEPVALLTLDRHKLDTALSHEAFYSHILTLKINNKSEKVILKDVQRDPSRPRIHHIDFLRIRADQKLTMNVPLHFIGDSEGPGVKQGGLVSHLMSDVEVVCLPKDLPEYIEVNTSKLEMGETIHLSDLKLPKGIELVAFAHGVEDHDLPVASVHKPRSMADEEIVAAPAEEGADAAKSTGETKA